jgi:hypothetical protein
MVASRKTEKQADHLELAAQYLSEHGDNPSVAVLRYVKALLPDMENEFAVQMSAFLIGSVGSMILRSCPDIDPLGAKRLASIIVMSILPAGADLGMQSRSSVVGCPWSVDDRRVADNGQPTTDNGLTDWFNSNGIATVYVSEHRSELCANSLILLPIDEETAELYRGHIQDVDLEHDSRAGAWNYREIKVRMVS